MVFERCYVQTSKCHSEVDAAIELNLICTKIGFPLPNPGIITSTKFSDIFVIQFLLKLFTKLNNSFGQLESM